MIDLLLQSHRHFFNQQCEVGYFIASCPQVLRVGSVIFAKEITLRGLEEILSKAPFLQNEIAEYAIIEFDATKCVELTQ